MNQKHVVILVVSTTLFLAFGADVPEADFPFINIGTNTYTNAHLRVYSLSEGSLRHDGGIEKIHLSDLPEPCRTRFYNAESAERAEADRKLRADAVTHAVFENYKTEHCRIIGGKLSDTTRDFRWVALSGRVERVLTNGILLRLYTKQSVYHRPRAVRPDSLTSSGNFLGSSGSSSEGYYSTERVATDVVAFVACDPAAENVTKGENRNLLAIKTSPVKIGAATHPGYDAGLPYHTTSP